MNFVRPPVQLEREAKGPCRTAEALVEAGLLAPEAAADAEAAAALLPIAVTPHLAALIDRSDAGDPIARQFVPHPDELGPDPLAVDDPIGDAAHSPAPGIVHRYPDRALLLPLTTCPVYCRFCFRRETVGGGALTQPQLAEALSYIASHTAIQEVILSGGDPLALSPRRMRRIVAALDAMAHVETIRIHSRVPVADPQRITAELVAAMKAETPVWVVLHCNHPQELSPETRDACRRLVDSGIPMLSQTVLLRGVNDDAATMEALMRALVRNRIKPYYLHHADRTRGTAHFRTTLAEGRALMKTLRGRLTGIAQPTYVLDIPGGFGKVPVGPDYLTQGAEAGCWQVEDWQGRSHRYAETGDRS